MYEVADTIYCYLNSDVLKNKARLKTTAELEVFEAEMTAKRSDEPLPAGRLSVSHFRAIHRHLFQDVYSWAGQLRRIRIARGGNMFCYPENIRQELTSLFRQLKANDHLKGLSANAFASKAASFLASLNAIHAFREGNGRTQLIFMAILADNAGHPLHRDKLRPKEFLLSMIASFGGDEAPLRGELLRMIG